MEKKAFKFNKPGFLRMFSYGTDKQLKQAVRRQRLLRSIINMVPKNQRRTIIRQLDDQIDSMGPLDGTIFNTRKGKKVLINRSMRKASPEMKRTVLSHEAFHAKNPLGGSELLAHIYGGVKGKKGGFLDKVRAGLGQAGHAVKTRPVRVGLEVSAAGGAGYGAKKLTDKLVGKKNVSAKPSK